MAKKFDAKAKAKRQKIIAAVLGVVLLAALAYEVPSLLAVMNKKAPLPPVVAPPPAPGTAPATTLAPGTGSAVSAPATGSSTLADSDPVAQAGSGQLVSFDRFASKDPFVQQANSIPKPTRPAKPATPPPPPPPPPASKVAPAKPTSAQISVNGVPEQVGIGQTFPQADPLFRLVSLTNKTAKIGIAAGSLATGSATVTLTKGKKVTLMNTADGTRYELVLVSVGTSFAPSAP
ncbi:MAG: hypothetical protein E6G45_06015 [Actinobacteria bacterium]|nr:MAG: hypothetical protein E6G45_06015 [Actinomycetota bacterium]